MKAGSLQLVKSYIEGTTTKTGLEVKAFLNGRQYVKGKTVPDELFKTIPLSRHSELPAWNYTLRPNGGLNANLLCAAAKTGGRMIAP
jgi:Rhodopirellula transposase DDE domain